MVIRESMRLGAAVVLLVLAGAACSESSRDIADPDSAAVVVDARLGQTFDLQPGQTARVGDSGLLIGFRAVYQDSRCATDVVCVWAGDAALRIRAAMGRSEWTPIDLHTSVDPRSARFGDYTISVVALSPEPRSQRTIPGDSYKVTLRVE